MTRADDRSRAVGPIPITLLSLGLLVVVGCGREESLAGRAQATPGPADSRATAPKAVEVSGGTGPAQVSPTKPPPVPAPSSTIKFRDVSQSTGIDFTHVSGNSPEKHYPAANGSGVAVLDYDGDGLLDIYFVSTREFPLDGPTKSQGNRLYRNRGGATFEDVTDCAGVGFHGFCHGVAVGDVDNNGFPDLYLCNYGPNVLYLNRGDGTFHRAKDFGADSPSWSTSAAFLDIENDGDLDLYVSTYGRWAYDEPHPFCGDEARGVRIYCPPVTIPPDHHFLFRNRGDGTFEDVTERAGVLRRDGRGMGVVTADVNRDGRTDIYVANDMCPHFLFLNKGDGTFEDATNSSGAAVTESGHYQGGMGVDVEDLDGDGFPELFVTNFDGEYNTIHRTTDGRNFDDVSASAGIVKDSMPFVGWGCSLTDFDLDGLPDMLVVNGHVDDNLGKLGRAGAFEQRPMIWKNQGRRRFRLVTDPGPFFLTGHAARGAAFGDLDNDGDVDVVINRMDNRPAVLLNESSRGHGIRLDLIGTKSNRSAIGTAVEVHAGDQVLHRQVKGGGSYASANDTRLVIGVGKSERVDRVEIRWPSGERSTLSGLEVDRSYKIAEPGEGSDGRPTRQGGASAR